MYFKAIREGHQLAAWVGERHPNALVLGKTEEQLPLLAVKLGGSRKPAVVIRAGGLAAQIGAIHGALTLLESGAGI